MLRTPELLSLASLSALSTSGVPRCSSLGGLSGPEVRRDTPGASGCIEVLQARDLEPAPPDALAIATLPRDCPKELRSSPSSPSGGAPRVTDRDRAPSTWSALYGLLPQR